MDTYVLGLEAVDRTRVALVGGKGAHLGELARIAGVAVPDGFCVTTHAFRRFVAGAPGLDAQLDGLSRLGPDDRAAIGSRSAAIRRTLEGAALPDEVAAAITRALARLGPTDRYAVRSSATAEDQPTASFAGQHDTYLEVAGPAVVGHVVRCWASLFTERAVSYRLRARRGRGAGFDPRAVQMAVVVQRMVSPEVSGVLFTADPVTGNRRVSAVEATVGLGEALVSGRADADRYTVRDGAIVERVQRHGEPPLTDPQLLQLERLGRRIEAHFGCPQDLEWCLVDGGFQLVQSRPITTLFPVPEVGDGEPRVFLSVGHQQMMTDPMRPLGLSLFQLTAGRPMYEAGGRLFVDVTAALASPAGRAGLLGMAGRSDPLVGDALQTLIDRGFVPSADDEAPAGPPGGPPPPLEADPAVVAELVADSEASLATCAREIRTRSGADLLDFVLADLAELKRLLFDPRSHRVILAVAQATWWLDEQLQAWLGEVNAADVLTRSVDGNVTSQMGLALLDVADVIRPHPEVVAFLAQVDDGFLDALPAVAGGREARDAIAAWLDRYGMRCPGEIDLTRPRWRERPTTLLPLLLGHVAHHEPGAAARRWARGLQQAREAERDILARLRALPDGDRKADEAARTIARLRTFAGYREYPKYAMIRRYGVYRQALREEAARQVRAGVLHAEDDVFYLTLPELREVVGSGEVDHALVRRRREAFESYGALHPPRVITSDGEIVAGSYRRDALPPDALVGLAVSAGTVEGRARIVRDPAGAELAPGDILVTTYTDPSWTPLFVAVAGLVTEVGGRMTHGAVIAREYGLPAVVGVVGATRRIRDGQRIRVHGTEGYVELLPG